MPFQRLELIVSFGEGIGERERKGKERRGEGGEKMQGREEEYVDVARYGVLS